MHRTARIGVDIGGTFTDFVMERGGEQFCLKLLTTPDAPERAVLDGISRLLADTAIPSGDIEMVVHGTTLATNAVIERKGAKVAFLTTKGFRDTLEMGYEHRYDQYDLLVDKPKSLVPRRLRLPIPERIAADGRVLTPIDQDAVRAAAQTLAAEGIEAIGIGFLHSYANADHEIEAARILSECLPDLPISLSSDVSPEIREYERFTTVAANAYVQPLMARYLDRLATALVERGIRCPLYLMQSNGGLCDVETARRYPVRLLESGPAGGAIFGATLARELNLSKVLLLDIGGTTAKLCFIDDARPQTARSLEVARIDRFKPGSGLPLRFPVIELCEIGAGGGSKAAVDRLKRLTVGPESAGSTPGPACYGRGGKEPTVTDAHLTLGRLDPARFAGGSFSLDTDAARIALSKYVAAPLSVDVRQAALGVIEIVNENMANAAREHAIEVGKGVARRTLIAIGGAASLHAADLAAKLDIDEVIIPSAAGVGSAIGFLRAPVAFEKSQSQHQVLSGFRLADALQVVDELIASAIGVIAPAAKGIVPLTIVSAHMRYRGQGHEIPVTIDRDALGNAGSCHLRDGFQAAYQHLYGRTIAGSDIEVLSWTVRAELTAAAARHSPFPQTVPSGTDDVCRLVEQGSGKDVTARRLDRTALRIGERFTGPTIVIDTGTTVIVPSGCDVEVLAGGHLRLQRWRADVRTEAAE